jgi:hypothetical protein
MTKKQMTRFVVEQMTDTDQCDDCHAKAKFAIHGMDCVECMNDIIQAHGTGVAH